MEHFMREFVSEDGEFFGGLQVGLQTNLAAERNA
jgi:hypothetical protein